MTSDNPFGIFKLLSVVFSVLRFTTSDNPFGIFKLLAIALSVLRLTASDQHNDQKLEDTKGVIRSCISKERQHNDQKLEDTKGVIRIRKSKDRQHNGQKLEYTKGVVSSSFWPLRCLFFDLWLLITLLVSSSF
jgi:hypothetical protein